jgi:hypothetical protein
MKMPVSIFGHDGTTAEGKPPPKCTLLTGDRLTVTPFPINSPWLNWAISLNFIKASMPRGRIVNAEWEGLISSYANILAC